MATAKASISRKKNSFLIKDILSDDTITKADRDEHAIAIRRHHNFNRNQNFHHHERKQMVPLCEPASPCSCHRSRSTMLGCTLPPNIHSPTPKFPCGCHVPSSRNQWPLDFICCQPQRINQSPRHVSSLPSRCIRSPEDTSRESITEKKPVLSSGTSEDDNETRPTSTGTHFSFYSLWF